MRNVVLIIAAGITLLPHAAAAQIVPVTNIEIRMVKTSTRPPLRITAQTRNPNDFALRDMKFRSRWKVTRSNALRLKNSSIETRIL